MGRESSLLKYCHSEPCVTSEGIKISPSKAEAVKNWPVPTNRKELMSFLGFVKNHRDHVPNFASLTASLYTLAHEHQKPIWEPEHEEVFLKTKQALSSTPCLVYPKPSDKFILIKLCQLLQPSSKLTLDMLESHQPDQAVVIST
jgi:hypothetical protein